MLCVCECVVVVHGMKCRESSCATTISLYNVSSSFVLFFSDATTATASAAAKNETPIQTTHSQTHTYSSTFVVYRIGRFFCFSFFLLNRLESHNTRERESGICNRYIQCERTSRRICTTSAAHSLDSILYVVRVPQMENVSDEKSIKFNFFLLFL